MLWPTISLQWSALQVFAKHEVTEAIVNTIQAGHVSAIGSTDINTNLIYVINPQVHTDLNGNPTDIVGNASDEKNKFSLVQVSLQSLG